MCVHNIPPMSPAVLKSPPGVNIKYHPTAHWSSKIFDGKTKPGQLVNLIIKLSKIVEILNLLNLVTKVYLKELQIEYQISSDTACQTSSVASKPGLSDIIARI